MNVWLTFAADNGRENVLLEIPREERRLLPFGKQHVTWYRGLRALECLLHCAPFWSVREKLCFKKLCFDGIIHNTFELKCLDVSVWW